MATAPLPRARAGRTAAALPSTSLRSRRRRSRCCSNRARSAPVRASSHTQTAAHVAALSIPPHRTPAPRAREAPTAVGLAIAHPKQASPIP
eukprot:2500311-Prymnesium_polylepis.1